VQNEERLSEGIVEIFKAKAKRGKILSSGKA
jgi:hypothetical protein